jgi:hypothetical protein
MDRETALSLATQAIAQAGACIVIKVHPSGHAWAFGPYVSAEDVAGMAVMYGKDQPPAIIQPWFDDAEDLRQRAKGAEAKASEARDALSKMLTYAYTEDYGSQNFEDAMRQAHAVLGLSYQPNWEKEPEMDSRLRNINGNVLELRAGLDGFCVELNGVQIFWSSDFKECQSRFYTISVALSVGK